jgi:glycosyltransferase 2 family protein
LSDTKTTKQADILQALDVTDTGWASLRSIVLGLVIGSIFLLLAFRNASFQGFVDTLETARVHYLLVGIGLYAVYLVARTSRWSLLLAERTETRPFAVLFRALTWGTAANTVIPHSGEILRSLVTRQPLSISAASILGTIASERLYDFGTIIAFAGITLVLFHGCPTILHTALCSICFVGLVLLAGLVLLGFRFPQLVHLIDAPARLFPKRYRDAPRRHIGELSLGIQAALSNPRVMGIGVLSICQWLCIAGCIYFSMASLGLGVSPWLAFIVLPVTIAGLTLPTAPVYLGTMQLCFLAGLTPFGVSKEAAIAASVAYTGIITVPVIVISLFWYVIYVVTRNETF